ncbi:C-type lectin domain family 17, member A isoform X2 [Sarcophilus harrisii]|uniref:C-type lectin domain containing 17A n=1 Tax=Sarcophilus harrisii TaxID=9305 RepID=A0A7N4V2R5_SARHA|nr:C-type lectin domain family 17, member A isoform X2 [Sarcophilus harrisii]
MSFPSMYKNFLFRGQAGVTENTEGDDYENMAPTEEDLPPEPGTRKFPRPGSRLGWLRGSIVPPRPPRAGKKIMKPALPSKSPQAAGLSPAVVNCPTLPQMGLHLNSPAYQLSQMAAPNPQPIQEFQPSQVPQLIQMPQPSQMIHSNQGFQFTQVSQLSQGSQLTQKLESSQKRKIPQFSRKEKMTVCFCILVGISLLLGVTSLAVTLMKLTGPRDLVGLRKYIDRIRDDTNRTITELRDIIDCARKSCPKNWLLFGNSCYFFSTVTKSWDAASIFCLENYSHLVIISSTEEQNFVTQARSLFRTYWLGLTDRETEGKWQWLDGSSLILSFWKDGEPNNKFNEDCGFLLPDGQWNDANCDIATYWICEGKSTC